ncbi:hypothetical protein J6590_029235 [Homalodisca vitripennis]|nr:hypothetical protein J6590_029235 [Homalodisca vitripennis]
MFELSLDAINPRVVYRVHFLDKPNLSRLSDLISQRYQIATRSARERREGGFNIAGHLLAGPRNLFGRHR